MLLLSPSEIPALVEAAVACGLARPDRRDLLFTGLPADIQARIAHKERPADQVEADLVALFALERDPRTNGLSPLVVWLANAHRHAGARREAAPFAAALAGVDATTAAALDALGASYPRRAPIPPEEPSPPASLVTHMNTVGAVQGGSIGISYGHVTINHSISHPSPDDPRSLREGVQRYLRPIHREAILGEAIPRDEAAQVVREIESGPKRGVVVVGPAGVGKSSVIAQVVEHFVDAGWPVAALRLDRVEPTATVEALGAALGLSASPTAALLDVAGGRPCLIVVDQLDAVSATAGRHPQFFERVEELVDDVQRTPNLRLVMGCRAFDLDNDHRIRRLTRSDGIAAKVAVALLSPEVVRQVVARAGRDGNKLTDKQLRLLSLPFNLWLWTIVAERADEAGDGDGALVIDTGRALLDTYWEQQRRRLDESHPRARGRWQPLLDELLDYMGDNRVPSAPRRRFEDKDYEALAALESEHVVTREKEREGRVAFPHETLFDYLFARSFIARGKDLLSLLRAREQEPFLRTTVRQILQHMRSGDAEADAYVETLRGVLMAPDVRFHIKQVVLAWLEALEDPREIEWIVLKACIDAAPAEEVWQWERRTLTGPWFDLLLRLGYVHDELASADAERVERVVRRIHWAAESRGEAVCEIVEKWLDRGGEWPRRLVHVMSGGRAHETPRWIDLYFAVKRQHPEVIPELLNNVRSRFLTHLPVKAPTSALRIASEALEQSLTEWWRRLDQARDASTMGKLDLSLKAFGHDWTWHALAERVPAAFIDEILPMILAGARLASPRGFIHPEKPMQAQGWWGRDATERLPLRDRIWFYFSVGRYLDDKRSLLVATGSAIANLHDAKPDRFAQVIELLTTYNMFETAGLLLLRALAGAGPVWADHTVELLMAHPHLLEIGYSDASYWVAREAIERATLWCSPTIYAKFEVLLLDYVTPYERERWRLSQGGWKGRDGRWRLAPHLSEMGRSQFTLLNGLPPARQSTEVRRRVAELRRRFDRDDEAGPQGARGGVVGPPFTAPWARMTDAQWLRAMQTYNEDDPHRRGADFLKGGARQLAGQLEEQTKAEPARFAAIFHRLPEGVNRSYPDAILRGMMSAAKDSRRLEVGAVWDVLRNAFDLGDRRWGRWTWDLVVAYADESVPADILDQVAWYATEDPDPHWEERSFTVHSPGQREGHYDAENHGLNTVRGGMCWAIEALLFKDAKRITRLRSAIERLIHDPSLAVRMQVPHALLPMLTFEANTAVELFLTLCERDAELVPLTSSGRHFLDYACRTYLDRLVPLFDRMLSSVHHEVRQNAAQWLALAVYREQREVTLMEDLWARGDNAIRAGLAAVACWIIGDADHPHHSVALSVLQRSFSEDESVISEAVRCFWEIEHKQGERSISLLCLTPLFDAFIDSSAFESNRSDLMYLLDESGLRLPDVVLRAFEKTLTVGPSFGAFDTPLLYRLYEDSVDPVTRRRCLDLIDGLLSRGDYELQRTLQQLDGPS